MTAVDWCLQGSIEVGNCYSTSCLCIEPGHWLAGEQWAVLTHLWLLVVDLLIPEYNSHVLTMLTEFLKCVTCHPFACTLQLNFHVSCTILMVTCCLWMLMLFFFFLFFVWIYFIAFMCLGKSWVVLVSHCGRE